MPSRLHIAIIGMACRAPDVRSPEAFWRKLQDPAWPGAKRVIDGWDEFDAASFGVTPAEAAWMDPQQRIFLECAREALERAAYDPEQYEGTIGVFASAGASRYAFRALSRRAKGDVGLASLLGFEKDYLSVRAAYHLGLTGPSVTIQTACSSSLSAVHAACQALLTCECDVALAGGVSLVLAPDEDDGSSACGVVVLKPFARAIEDGDTIHAVIRGTGINNDGRARSGFASPGVKGQAALITEVIELAGISPDTIDYLELHGATSDFGGAAEDAAMDAAFGAARPPAASLQAQLGSLDSASGIMALIRSVAFAQTGKVPGAAQIRANAHGRVAVHSFGIGGANAHVVVEKPPAGIPRHSPDGVETLLFSAGTPEALDALCVATSDWLVHHPQYSIRDVAYTLRRGRRSLPFRRAVRCSSVNEAVALLRRAAIPPSSDPDVVRWLAGETVHFDPGQGRRVDLPPVPFVRQPCVEILDQPLRTSAPVPKDESEIRKLWLETLALNDAATDSNFFESGGTSLLAVQLIDTINRAFGCQLPVRTLYEFPTLNSFIRAVGGFASALPPPSSHHQGDIAIIGAACRFPGARNLDEYWELLRNGQECIRRDPGVDEAETDPTVPHFVPAVSLLDDIESFDHVYFGISPAEAQLLDPQIRLLLETAAQALDDAACPPLPENRIGLFAGGSPSAYLLNILTNAASRINTHPLQVSIANDRDALTTTVSYRLNLRGPSVTVQTFCSTSLAAVHLARQSLLLGECDTALAGGVSLNLLGRKGYTYQPSGIYSADGHCRSFDADATGTVFGEGVGVVVLKRLEDARAAGDRILAVIKGSAMNNDGSAKAGYTAPSMQRQAEVIQEALAASGLSARAVSYVEAHGTATQLGDSIEFEALTRAFRSFTTDVSFCGLGSVKSNFGHLDRAAGVASLLKVVLALLQRKIPPTLHYRSPNPQITLEDSPFFISDKLIDWHAGDDRRRAGVTALGIGGTNVHVVVEEYTPMPAHRNGSTWHLLPLSAHTETSLARLTDQTTARLRSAADLSIADVAYTLQQGRRALPWRRFLVCQSTSDAATASERRNATRALSDPAVVFLLPGQGSQHVSMARDLYAESSFFRETLMTCLECMGAELRDEILVAMYPSPGSETAAGPKLRSTEIAQPALFAQEYAMARLWMELGVRPRQLIGHSVGEFVAAALSGVMSLHDAAQTVAERGRLMQAMPTGALLSVMSGADDCGRWIDDRVCIAAINEARSTVLAGPSDDIERIRGECSSLGIATAIVPSSHAFHSSMMDGALPAFRAFIGEIPLHEPSIPFYSNVTGALISTADATSADYWAAHIRRTVRFADSLAAAAAKGVVFLESGPGDVLTAFARRYTPQAFSSMPSARHAMTVSGMKHFLETLGSLWSLGVDVQWKQLDDGRRSRVAMPGVPLEPKRHWIESQTGARITLGGDDHLLGYVPSWRQARKLSAPSDTPPSDWIVLAQDDRDALTEGLEKRGQRVVMLLPGDRFEQVGNARYSVRPDRLEDFQEILERHPARRIVYLWAASTGDARDALRLGFHALRVLTQAIALDVHGVERVLTVITRNVFAISGDEELNPFPALVRGICKVAPKEMPGLVCQTIDLDSASLDACLDELLASSPATDVALRGRVRWTLGYEAVSLEQAMSPGELIRNGGVYWITGGTGALGLAFAQMLAERRCRLVLTHRSELPPRNEWESAIAADGNSRTARVLRRLLHIEGLAGGLLVYRADVCSENAMSNAVAAARARFSHIDGAIHAAGIPGGGVLALKTEAMADAVIVPKVIGAQVLCRVLDDDPPDFVALCSSIASVTGDFGQADYCAANSFLDAFAHSRTAAGAFTQAINWGPWREAGMAVDTEVPEQWRRLRAEGLRDAIRTRDGVAAFSAALSLPESQLVIVPSDLEDWRAQADAVVASALEKTPLTDDARATCSADSPNYIPPETEVQRKLVAILEDALSLTGIGIDDDFFALGGNSLLALQMLPQLRASFGTRIGSAHVFQYSTARRLAEYLETPTVVAQDALERGARIRASRTARGVTR